MLKLLYNTKYRNYIIQSIFTLIVLYFFYSIASNTYNNLQQQGIAFGLNFLDREAGFDIGDNFTGFTPASSYYDAFIAGIVNTLWVSFFGIILSTILGTIIGILRLSNNYMMSRLAGLYVLVIRNIPLLLILIFIYSLFNTSFPSPREADPFWGNIYVTNRGIITPRLIFNINYIVFLMAAIAILFLFKSKWVTDKINEIYLKVQFISEVLIKLIVLFLILLVSFLIGTDIEVNNPELTGFNFVGGRVLSPEFMALLLGLTMYTAAFIAEIVRAGILGVPKGQWEASRALGFTNFQMMKLIIFPQSLRIIVPPITSQYLNLTKNSSLAVAIGYADIVSVSNTIISQTGQALEVIAIYMAVYLIISLAISLFMNIYNKLIALQG